MNDINNQKWEVEKIAKKLFDYFTSLPQDIRPEVPGKTRPGIFIYAEVPGTRNILRLSRLSPSEAAISFAQIKCCAIRFLNSVTSRDVADPERNIWPGAVSCTQGENNPSGLTLTVGVSGLFSEEDEVIAIRIAAQIAGYSPIDLIHEIESRGGSIDPQIKEEGHYLNTALNLP